MIISNVHEIFDNGEFISVVTLTGTAVHLPKGKHSIVVDEEHSSKITIEFYEG